EDYKLPYVAEGSSAVFKDKFHNLSSPVATDDVLQLDVQKLLERVTAGHHPGDGFAGAVFSRLTGQGVGGGDVDDLLHLFGALDHLLQTQHVGGHAQPLADPSLDKLVVQPSDALGMALIQPIGEEPK